jgi:N-acetylmuramoyl-L-alanine amidase
MIPAVRLMDRFAISFNRLLFSLVLGMVIPVSPISLDADDRDVLTIHYGGRSLAVEVMTVQDRDYLPARALEKAFGGQIERQNNGFGLSFRFGSGAFLFEDRIPYFSYENRPYQLMYPPLVRGDDFLLPYPFFSEYLPYFFPDLLSHNARSSSLRDRRYDNFIRGIKRSAKKSETVVFMHSSTPPRFEVDASRAGMVSLDIFETKCSRSIADSLSSFGYIDSTRITETGRSTRIDFYIQPSVRRYRIAEIQSPPGISIVFSGEKVSDRKAREKDRDLVSGIIDPNDFLIRTVVIDPGHGGKDPGAIGGNGLREKDINLEVSLKVEALLKKKTDLKVIMTRKKDAYVSLGDRTKKANRSNANLFVSIHCNSSKNRELKGFEAYFLSAAKTDHERAVAHRENLSVRFDEPSVDSTSLDDLQFIFWDLAQNEYLRESEEWAEIMRAEFTNGSEILGRRDVRQAGFFVLNGAKMPSLLLELGYISNRVEEKLLSDKGYQNDLADRISRGIVSYIDRYHKKLGK